MPEAGKQEMQHNKDRTAARFEDVVGDATFARGGRVGHGRQKLFEVGGIKGRGEAPGLWDGRRGPGLEEVEEGVVAV